MFFKIISEPANLHWFDVKENYFNEYRDNMDGFFKAPGGKIKKYDEMKRKNIYKLPYYRESNHSYIDEEARKFLFSSNEDFANCKKICQKLKRSMIQVS